MSRISLAPPRTPLNRLSAWYTRRKYGMVPDPVLAVGHNGRVATAYALFELQAHRWNRDVDFGTWELNTQGLALDKLKEVPRWRESEAFTERERLVLEYGEAMTTDPPAVTDELTGMTIRSPLNGPCPRVARAKDGRAQGGQSRLLRPAEWLAVEAGCQGRR